MATLQLKGKVLHMPGSWGQAVPVSGASIKVIDIDKPGQGSSDDVIWTGTTDSNGNFQGQSSEWQDRKKITIPGYFKGTPPKWIPPHDEWVPDLTDIISLKAEITHGTHQVSLPLMYINDGTPSPPLVVPWGPTNLVTKEKRALVVVNYLVGTGSEDWSWLYSFLEAACVQVADTILGPSYKTTTVVAGNQATKQGFLNALHAVTTDPSLIAVDVIFSLHGLPEKLCFKDGDVEMNILSSEIQSLAGSNKLRIAYDLSCYGASHANDFLAAGFKTAAGSAKINANSSTEYPTVLALLSAGASFSGAITAGENPATRLPMDALATAAQFSPVDSHKTVYGNGSLTINVC